ncbi:hypothetical protein BJP36_42680 [Moorena producens JHB]|uniref:Uncharacterized protein n=1 Tax=Moorena producens (strain JHB) TaxID=1454205 RepID=A0A9Q9UVQ1_MOOP1|nr:hypothetical protein [Moorena producens]WAN69065.1 hypothetical protein BJP36_42680 [Moorena producens JHB]
MLDYATFICQSASKKRNDSVIVYWSDNYEILGNRESEPTPFPSQEGNGNRESGAVRPVANLIRLRKAHRGNREFGRGNHESVFVLTKR